MGLGVKIGWWGKRLSQWLCFDGGGIRVVHSILDLEFVCSAALNFLG